MRAGPLWRLGARILPLPLLPVRSPTRPRRPDPSWTPVATGGAGDTLALTMERFYWPQRPDPSWTLVAIGATENTPALIMEILHRPLRPGPSWVLVAIGAKGDTLALTMGRFYRARRPGPSWTLFAIGAKKIPLPSLWGDISRNFLDFFEKISTLAGGPLGGVRAHHVSPLWVTSVGPPKRDLRSLGGPEIVSRGLPSGAIFKKKIIFFS